MTAGASPSDSRGFAPTAGAIVVALSAAYVASQFFRTAMAVIAPFLTQEMHLPPERLGFLSGSFFLAFAVMQIPVGVLLDRIGPRKTIAGLLAFAVLGALTFSRAEGFALLLTGQLIMGAGCSCVLMGSVVVISRWRPEDRFTSTASIVLAVGGGGVVLSATPLAFVVEALGWRGAYVGVAGVTAVLAAAVWIVVRDAPAGHAFHDRPKETVRQALAGVWEAMREPRLRAIIVMSFISYASTVAVRGLWGGPYLADVYGLDPIALGNVLLAMSIAAIVGTLAYGPQDRIWRTRKRVVIVGALATLALLAVLALAPALTVWQVTVIFTLLAVFGSYTVMLMAHVRGLFPDRLIGRGITLANCANFAGVFVVQWAGGIINGAAESAGLDEATAYRAVFGFLAAVLALALLPYFWSRDVAPRGRPTHAP